MDNCKIKVTDEVSNTEIQEALLNLVASGLVLQMKLNHWQTAGLMLAQMVA